MLGLNSKNKFQRFIFHFRLRDFLSQNETNIKSFQVERLQKCCKAICKRQMSAMQQRCQVVSSGRTSGGPKQTRRRKRSRKHIEMYDNTSSFTICIGIKIYWLDVASCAFRCRNGKALSTVLGIG